MSDIDTLDAVEQTTPTVNRITTVINPDDNKFNKTVQQKMEDWMAEMRKAKQNDVEYAGRSKQQNSK